jgi:uncharacterized membrane protein YeiB
MSQPESSTEARPANQATEPAKPPRINGYDVARAVAIAAMILENFKVYLLEQRAEPHLLVWLSGLTDGRSAPLFVTLAGVGLALFTKPALEAGDQVALASARKVILIRSLFFLALSGPFIRVWSMDILHFFAAYFFLAAVIFLKSSRRQLLGAALGIVAISTINLVWRGEAYFDDVDYWTLPGMMRDTFLDGIHPVLPWLAFFLFGMWIGRLDLRNPVLRHRLLIASLAVAVGAELLSLGLQHISFVGLYDLTPANFPHLFTTRLSPPGPLYVISASATSLVAIVLCFALTEAFPSNRVVKALIAAGQLSLTLYLGHAIVGAGFLWAIGRLEDHSVWFLDGYWAGYFALSVLFAAWWRGRFKLGPLEWVMRSASGSAIRPRLRRGAALQEAPNATGETRPALTMTEAALCLGGVALVLIPQSFGLAPPRTTCPEPRSIAPGESLSGELTVLCPEHWFELTLDEPQRIVVTVDSGADSYLELFDAEGENPIDEDDDSGPGYNPILTTFLEAGSYRMLLHPYRSGTGAFTIRVE